MVGEVIVINGEEMDWSAACRDYLCEVCHAGLVVKRAPGTTTLGIWCSSDMEHRGFIKKESANHRERKQTMLEMEERHQAALALDEEVAEGSAAEAPPGPEGRGTTEGEPSVATQTGPTETPRAGPSVPVPVTAESREIQDWYNRLKRLPMPLPDPIRYVAARMAAVYGLDPFLGELILIPHRDKAGKTIWRIYVGIEGMRRAARRTKEYGGRVLRPCTQEQREALGIVDGDTFAWYCEVYRKGYEKPFDGYGVFPMDENDVSRAPGWAMAQKRAEHRALKAAFDLQFELREAEVEGYDEPATSEAEPTVTPKEIMELGGLDASTEEIREVTGLDVSTGEVKPSTE